MENYNQKPVVGIGVLILKDGKVLLGKRKGSHGAGTYAFPGGHLEYRESFEECARRETTEETGLVINNIRFNFVGNELHPEKHVTHISFIADWENGEPLLLEPNKCEGWGWYELNNLPEPMFEMGKVAIKNLSLKKSFYDLKDI